MSESVFKYRDYKGFVRDRIASMGADGHGQYRAMAKHMRVHASLLSHVMRGSKDLTSEQGCSLAEFLRLEQVEADYFVALIEHARAGTSKLADSIERRMKMLRERHLQIEYRLTSAKTLSSEQQAVFYSQWYYSAIRLTASLEGVADTNAIATRLRLPIDVVERALAFLISARLLVRKNDRYFMVPQHTHLSATSPLTSTHHRNWRTKAMGMYEGMTQDDLAFSSAITLEKEDLRRIRELFVECIAKAVKIIEPSKCETLAVLNIDLIEF